MAVITLRGFVKNAQQVVEQTKVNMAMKISNGSLPSMEQYHRQCGRLEGMDQAIALLKEMLNQLEEAERDENLPEMTGTDQ